MTMDQKFFSPGWCAEAQVLVNADESIYAGFQDPVSFTNQMGIAVTDRDLRVHLEWQSGKVVSWAPAHFDADVDDLWLVIQADLATWREAADGESAGGSLLLEDRIKIVRGAISSVIDNGAAFNAFLRTWGAVPTDWAV